MLTVTETATEHLSEMLEDQPKNRVVRFEQSGSRLVPVIGVLGDNDEVIECHGRPVLALDPELCSELVASQLDATQGEDGTFRLQLLTIGI